MRGTECEKIEGTGWNSVLEFQEKAVILHSKEAKQESVIVAVVKKQEKRAQRKANEAGME